MLRNSENMHMTKKINAWKTERKMDDDDVIQWCGHLSFFTYAVQIPLGGVVKYLKSLVFYWLYTAL